jgi:hypothetical protein
VGWGLEGRNWRLGALCSRGLDLTVKSPLLARRTREKWGTRFRKLTPFRGAAAVRYFWAAGPFDSSQGRLMNAPVPT